MDTNNSTPSYKSPFIGGGVGAAVFAHQISKKVPKRKAGTLAALSALGTMGITYPIEYRLRRAHRYSSPVIYKEASTMHADFFNKTDLDAFVKTAADRMGNIAYQVPTPMAYDAMRLFEQLPEKNAAAIVCNLYDTVEHGMNKVAMEMVAANILAREKTAAGPVQAARTAWKGAKSMFKGKGIDRAMTAGEVAATGYGVNAVAEDRSNRDAHPYVQGSTY